MRRLLSNAGGSRIWRWPDAIRAFSDLVPFHRCLPCPWTIAAWNRSQRVSVASVPVNVDRLLAGISGDPPRIRPQPVKAFSAALHGDKSSQALLGCAHSMLALPPCRLSGMNSRLAGSLEATRLCRVARKDQESVVPHGRSFSRNAQVMNRRARPAGRPWGGRGVDRSG